jgi:Fur family ferric uptake transcriptional regulator
MSCNYNLKEKGLKLTPQRRLIIDIIHDADTHLTADTIIATVQDRMPGVNKSTIYRTLELLEGVGCVYKSELEDQYVYHHAEEGQHHHLVCTGCGNTVDCSEDLFAPVKAALARKYDFRVDFNHIVINGLCRSCSGRSKF